MRRSRRRLQRRIMYSPCIMTLDAHTYMNVRRTLCARTTLILSIGDDDDDDDDDDTPLSPW